MCINMTKMLIAVCVCLMKEELFTLPEHLGISLGFRGFVLLNL